MGVLYIFCTEALVRYMCCKYCLPVCVLPIYFLNSALLSNGPVGVGGQDAVTETRPLPWDPAVLGSLCPPPGVRNYGSQC